MNLGLLKISELKQIAKDKPEGYLEDILQNCKENDGTYCKIEIEVYKKLREKYSPSALEQTKNVLQSIAHATKAIIKTRIPQNRVTDEEFHRRLSICKSCEHAVFKHEQIHTCGKMLESMRKLGKGTCGCVLNSKARLVGENCPFDYWNTK